MQGRPETCGGPRRLIIKCLLKPISFELYDIGQTGQAIILRVVDNFRRNAFAYISTIPTELPTISDDFDRNLNSSKTSPFLPYPKYV